MKIEEYNQMLISMKNDNEKMLEKKKKRSGRIKLWLTYAVIFIIILILCIFAIVFQKHLPSWMSIASWIVGAFCLLSTIGAFSMAFFPDEKEKEDIIIKEEYDKSVSSLKFEMDLYKNSEVDLELLDEKDYIVFNEFRINENDFCYSDNTLLKYDSFEKINDEDKVVLEEYE